MNGFDERFERLEIKYLIDEFMVDRLRRDIEPFCNADAHNDTNREQPGYSISSLYLDSPTLAFHRAKERGDPERVKLRIRTYGDSPTATMEIKRKVSNVIDKTRTTILRRDAESAALGLLDSRIEPAASRRVLDDFAYIVATSGARPTLEIRYDREAYVSLFDTYARVTFDRKIGARRTESWTPTSIASGWAEFDNFWRPDQGDRRVVLELKCESVIPFWMSDMVRKHSLLAQSFSKYSIGIFYTGRSLGERFVPRRSAKVMIA